MPLALKRARDSVGEDVFLGDRTTASVGLGNPVVRARIVANGRFVLAGVREAKAVLGEKGCVVKGEEGRLVSRGDTIISLEMPARDLLRRSRTALNYLSHLSGLATNANRLSKKFGRYRVAALRKTHPGLGISEKNALQLGGVMAHRINLGDAVLVKKEHISLLKKELLCTRKKAVEEAARRAVAYASRGVKKGTFVEVEVENYSEAVAASGYNLDAILLDNMTVSEVKRVARGIRGAGRKTLIEVSGGVTEKNTGLFLKAGADFVSGSFVLFSKPADFRLVLDL